jgi:hypothetical protein
LPRCTNNSTYNAANTGSATPYPQSSPAFNQCSPNSQTYSGVSAGGNYDGDTVAIASPNGSSTGIASLNGDHGGTQATYAYEGSNQNLTTSGDPNATNGTSNGYGTLDFAFSSRAAKTTGGNCALNNTTTGAANDELQCDTFWGIASDGVEVFTWGQTSSSGTVDNTQLNGITDGLTAADLYNIYECKITTWGQLPEYAEAVSKGDTVPPSAAPIVPWAMNSNSGTYADFNNYVSANDGTLGTMTADDQAAYYSGGTATSPTPPTGKCARELAGSNPLPLENDIKPLLTDVQNNQGGISTDAMSTNNPANWIWFGSFGLLSAYQYLSQPSLFGMQFSTFAAPINGTTPSTSNIGKGTYPIPRILSLVTKKTDADCPIVSGQCNLSSGGPTNGNGTLDMNVTGGSSGASGAIREFIRFVCRDSAEETYTTNGVSGSAPVDPYTGATEINEIGAVISGSGFTLPPTAKRSPGSNCDVISAG